MSLPVSAWLVARTCPILRYMVFLHATYKSLFRAAYNQLNELKWFLQQSKPTARTALFYKIGCLKNKGTFPQSSSLIFFTKSRKLFHTLTLRIAVCLLPLWLVLGVMTQSVTCSFHRQGRRSQSLQVRSSYDLELYSAKYKATTIHWLFQT